MNTSFELSDNVIGVVLEEKMDREKLREIQKMVKDRLEKYSWVSLYLEDRYNKGATLNAFLEDMFQELSNSEPLLKIAVVTDRKRFKLLSAIKDSFLSSNVQSFDKKERMKAMNWLME